MKMKKFLVIGLAVALSACLVGCKDDEVKDPNSENPSNGNQPVVGTATGDVSGDIITLMNEGNVVLNAPYQDYITAEMAEFYVGLTQAEYEENIEQGVFFESMMNPANQSYCLLKVKDGADVAALQQKVFEKANPRKWICMSADRVLVMADSSYIMLAMGPVETCDALKAEFTELAGDDMIESLDKTLQEPTEIIEDMFPGLGDMGLSGEPAEGGEELPAASGEEIE